MYMLDTDICSYVIKTKSAKLRKKFVTHAGKISISEIVLAELRFGADNHQNRSQQIHDLINDFTARLDVIPWAASANYGQIRHYLNKSGTPIGNMDTFIAAHAVHESLILVTNNEKHFGKVQGLKIENWM